MVMMRLPEAGPRTGVRRPGFRSGFDQMRPKFVLTFIALAAFALAVGFNLKRAVAPPTAQEAVAPPAASAASVDGVASNAATATVVGGAGVVNTTNPAETQADVENEISRLQDLSTKADSASLSAILDDLANPEKAVRLAAIEATKQFGSRDAIATLKASVANTPDTDEQIALLQAADFLSLPTLSDSDVQLPRTPDQIQAAQQRRERKAALRLAQAQQSVQNLQPAPDQSPPDGPNN
jgi:hypothetical protein